MLARDIFAPGDAVCVDVAGVLSGAPVEPEPDWRPGFVVTVLGNGQYHVSVPNAMRVVTVAVTRLRRRHLGESCREP